MLKKNTFFDWVRTALGWLVLAADTIVLSGLLYLMMPILFPLPRFRKYFFIFPFGWARSMLAVFPALEVRIEGEEKLRFDEPYVLVANHQSLADIVAVLHLRHSFRFVAKRELFWIPFLGWSLWMMGHIPLVRGSHVSGTNAARLAVKRLREGVSVLFFPEGTRSRDGNIHDFKIGAFKIAAEEGRPLVPIVIDGTRGLIRKGNFMLEGKTRVTVSIAPPRYAQERDAQTIERFMIETRNEMIERLNKMRSTALRSAVDESRNRL